LVEKGRWRREGESEGWARLCKVCLCEEVEDEKHFLLDCYMYEKERICMFNRIESECELRIVNMNQHEQLDIMIGKGGGK